MPLLEETPKSIHRTAANSSAKYMKLFKFKFIKIIKQ